MKVTRPSELVWVTHTLSLHRFNFCAMGNFWNQAQTQQVLCWEYFSKVEHQVLVFPCQLLLQITVSYLSHLQVLPLSKQSWRCPKILSWGNTRDQRPSQCQQLQAAPLFWPPRAGKEHIPVPKTTQKILLTKKHHNLPVTVKLEHSMLYLSR